MASPEVRNDTDAQQYSLVEDGEVIGFAAYEVDGDEIRFTHTEVDPAHRGGGHASILVQHALDDVREGSLRVVRSAPTSRRGSSGTRTTRSSPRASAAGARAQ